MDDLLKEVRDILVRNDISTECIVSVIKLLRTDKFKELSNIDNQYVIMLNEIKSALEDDGLNDFACVEKIVSVFENSDIGIEFRHDF